MVTGADFVRARSEVQPAFGVDLASSSSSSSGNGGSLTSIGNGDDHQSTTNSSGKESSKNMKKRAWLERDSEAWHSAVASVKAVATCGSTSSIAPRGHSRSVSSLLLHGPSGVGKQTLMRTVLQQQISAAPSAGEETSSATSSSFSSPRVSSLYPMMRTLQPAKLLAMNSDDACAVI